MAFLRNCLGEVRLVKMICSQGEICSFTKCGWMVGLRMEDCGK